MVQQAFQPSEPTLREIRCLCLEEGCRITTQVTLEGLWVQHGENSEAVRLFTALEMWQSEICRARGIGGYFLNAACKVSDWLNAVHEYEKRQRRHTGEGTTEPAFQPY